MDADQWAWACGFYPGVEPAEHRQGTAAMFDEARKAFDEAWRRLRPRLTEADFEGLSPTSFLGQLEISDVGLRLSDADAGSGWA